MKYEKYGFPDTKRDIRSGGAVVRLGKSGTDSKLSRMVRETAKQKMGGKHTQTQAGEAAVDARGTSKAEERRRDAGRIDQRIPPQVLTT